MKSGARTVKLVGSRVFSTQLSGLRFFRSASSYLGGLRGSSISKHSHIHHHVHGEKLSFIPAAPLRVSDAQTMTDLRWRQAHAGFSWRRSGTGAGRIPCPKYSRGVLARAAFGSCLSLALRGSNRALAHFLMLG